MIGNLAGVFAPLITGFVLDRTGEYVWAFIIAAGFALLGTFALGILIPRVEPVEWPECPGARAAAPAEVPRRMNASR